MLKLGFELLLKKYICKHIKFRMKNAHLKTCNNLIFANIHRWYKIHTIKNVNDAVLRSWNKNLAVIPELLSPTLQGAENPVHWKSWELHGQSSNTELKKPLRTQILKTRFLRNHTDKRETQLCIFPIQSERYCILAFQMKMSNRKPSETLHTSPADFAGKQAPWGPGPQGNVLKHSFEKA